MNQPEMADALGCSVATVSRISSGDRLPSLVLMRRIRDVLSWSIGAQDKAIENETYHTEFTGRMDRRRLRRRMVNRGRVVDA
jgi:transcriptional regulator with XRE-family HTH domain